MNLFNRDHINLPTQWHLFEWCDFSFMPKRIKRFVTDHLAYHASRHYQAISGQLINLASRYNHKITDYCSGSGHTLKTIVEQANQQADINITAVLTDLNADKFNIARYEENQHIRYHGESVDLMDLSFDHEGIHTMFTSLHHFTPSEVYELLVFMQTQKRPFAAFEFTERRISTVAKSTLIGGFLPLFFNHKVYQKQRLRDLIINYVIAPWVWWWDGVASNMRTYTPRQLNELIAQLPPTRGYKWRVEQTPHIGHLGKVTITSLIGEPI